MSNKYLEKMAGVNGKAVLIGGGLGAGLGWVGSTPPKNDQDIKAKANRWANTATWGGVGAYLAARGTYTHDYRNYGGYKGSSGGGGGRSGGGGGGGSYRGGFSNIHDLHAKMEMPKGGFKTKAEAKKHFRKMSSKYHPDRHGGDASKMKDFNQAWQEFEKHPEGFEKLASNRILDFLDFEGML